MPTLFVSPDKRPIPHAGKKPRTHMGPLTAFALNPDGVRFETQEEKEIVILFLRQHIIVNLPWVFITILLILAPTVLFPVLFEALRINGTLPTGYYIVGALFWYLATFGFALASFIGWFFNIYIVTNERIVDIDFFYLLYKKFSEAELTKIQDISFATGGIIATLFNYGNITIETAGEIPNIIFEKVPQPAKVVETIRALTEHVGGDVV